MRAARILVYGDPAGVVSPDAVASFLQEAFGVSTQSRPPLPAAQAPQIPACRIRSLYRPHSPQEDPGDMDMHDALLLLDGLGGLLDLRRGEFHVVFTDILMGTFDEESLRYHARSLLAANPCIVSVPGMIEAPARPRRYCIDVMMGLGEESARDRYRDSFLDYGDSRLQAVAEGYAMQAVFYFETGLPPCANPKCRLFNAHWQSDLLRSQIPGRLCRYHEGILESLRG